ncbi:MAG: MerR family transcriptional regulator [Ilumatobacteraceae bacterium]
MNADDDLDDLVRVGDLSRTTGLTIRALHHYEEIGLLTHVERTPAGHRIYGRASVERLYRVGLLRRYGLSLGQIQRTLDDPDWSLAASLARHLDQIETEIDERQRLRAGLTAALADLDDDRDPTHDLMHILEDMMNNTLVKRRISILVYRDLAAAHTFLVDVFGFTPGDITTEPGGTVVHAEVIAGDGVIWLHQESDEFGLASPASVGAATAMMAIMVDDVDEHHRLVTEKAADIVYPPVDQPYGYREYSVRDPEGGLWSFMKPLEP